MPNTDESQAAESIAPSPPAQPAAPAGTIVRGRLQEPTTALEDQSGRDEIEALRRQVIALQRISSLGVLTGGVFHELNNTLTPIINYAKLGLRNPDPAYRERALTRILDAGQRAAAITGGMLGLSRPGRDPNHRVPVDLNRLVKEVVLLIHKDLARNKVRLEVQLMGRPFARVNPAQIQQVLINLLINARQAMPEGGVVNLRLMPVATGRLAELSVIDHGIGIAPGNLRRIFETFLLDQDRPRRLGPGRYRPWPVGLPRYRRGPPWPPARREPPGPGFDIHAAASHLPCPRRSRRAARSGVSNAPRTSSAARSAQIRSSRAPVHGQAQTFAALLDHEAGLVFHVNPKDDVRDPAAQFAHPDRLTRGHLSRFVEVCGGAFPGQFPHGRVGMVSEARGQGRQLQIRSGFPARA